MIDLAELSARITLRALPGLTDRTINRLLIEHASAESALAHPNHLIEVGARALPDSKTFARVRDILATIKRHDIHVVTPDHASYPGRLRDRLGDACPSLLFMIGNTEVVDGLSIAIVGSRAMSEYGRAIAEDFTRDLVASGMRIMSGLARGIDAVAHAAALDAHGETIAVVGNGADVVYPHDNAALRRRILRDGLIISQFLPGQRPAPHHFPERNLILAALCDGVLVVEAGAKSGACITARHATDLGVDSMAVPGPIGRPEYAGTNQLIREGCCECVTSTHEVLETMDRDGRAAQLAQQIVNRNARNNSGRAGPAVDDERDRDAGSDDYTTSPHARAIIAALTNQPVHIDEIATAVNLPTHTILSTLLHLELAGIVRQHPGARFERRAHVAAGPG